MKAIGMIETKGLVPAIESADAMLKAAEVTLIERRFVKGGLVTIIIAGDVAACKASVDAAASAVQRMGGQIISTHVIPRPHETLSGLITNPIPGDNDPLKPEDGDDDDAEDHSKEPPAPVDDNNGGGGGAEGASTVNESSEAEVKAEAEVEAKAEEKAEEQSVVKVEEQPVVLVEEKPVVKVEEKPVVKVEEQPIVKVEEKPVPEAEKAEAKVDVKPAQKAEKAEADAKEPKAKAAAKKAPAKKAPKKETAKKETVKKETSKKAQAKKADSASKKMDRKALDAIVKKDGFEEAIKELEKARVVALRTLAREYNGEFGISGREITRANKQDLIEEFRKYFTSKNN